MTRREWVRIRVETATHVGETSMPVYSQTEFVAGAAPPTELLGICIKPRVRVKMRFRMIGPGMPDDAEPGDLVLGNRGAAALVVQPLSQFGGVAGCLTLEYYGNMGMGEVHWFGGKVYDCR